MTQMASNSRDEAGTFKYMVERGKRRFVASTWARAVAWAFAFMGTNKVIRDGEQGQ